MKVVWTKRAFKRLAEISDFIETEFGQGVRNSFQSKAHDFTKLLVEFPELGTVEVQEKNLRGFQLTKQTRVFYRIKGNQILILTFFDSRRDPRKKLR